MKWAIFILFLSTQAFSHGKSKHSTPEDQPKNKIAFDDVLKSAYENINTSYKTSVEPILKGKCFDCHSAQTAHPWYYQIPGVNLLMNYHIKEGRAHLDMQKGYPFQGHGTPLEDLEEIEKTVKDGSMPPRSYRLFHRDSSLSKKETKIIIDWIKKSKQILKDLK